jgi:hypothetical protein
MVVNGAHLNMHQPLEYTAVEAKASWFSGRFPVTGQLEAELCEACGRVVFRASASGG